MKLPGMFSKNSKISVLNKMIGKEDYSETSQLIVPQNSLTNMRFKMGMCERDTITPASVQAFANTDPIKACNCPHCENMAKNLIYLESLIKSNYNSQYQCSLCYSVLKYLQFVNKRILKIFGNLDSVVGAAKLAPPVPAKIIRSHTRQPVGTRKSKFSTSLQSSTGGGVSKQKSKTSKLNAKSSIKRIGGKKSGKIASGISIVSVPKKASKSRSKIKLRKSSGKHRTTDSSINSTGSKVKARKFKLIKSKAKSRNNKSKHNTFVRAKA